MSPVDYKLQDFSDHLMVVRSMPVTPFLLGTRSRREGPQLSDYTSKASSWYISRIVTHSLQNTVIFIVSQFLRLILYLYANSSALLLGVTCVFNLQNWPLQVYHELGRFFSQNFRSIFGIWSCSCNGLGFLCVYCCCFYYY